MSILSNVHPMGVLSRGGAAAVMESAQDGKPAVIMKKALKNGHCRAWASRRRQNRRDKRNPQGIIRQPISARVPAG